MSYVQTLGSTKPTARKPHRCSLCNRTIRVGETYDRQANIFDDRLYAFKTCAHCEALIRNAPPSLQECIDWADDGYTDETVHDWDPTTITEARLKVLFRRKWTRRDGDLYPIPFGGAS